MALDARTRAGSMLRDAQRELTEQIGDPSPAQTMLITAAAVKYTRLCLGAEQALADLGDQHHWLSNTNSLRRDLEVLGLETRDSGPIDLHQYIKARDQEAS